MPNSIDFYKRIFLHVIPARIIVYGLRGMTLSVPEKLKDPIFEIQKFP